MLQYLLIISFIIPFLPLLYIQSLLIQRKVKKLPAADGDTGITGDIYEKDIRILIIGESTMAGVGILKHSNGFAGTLAKELSEKLKVNIHWKVYAKRGFTVKQLIKYIIPDIAEDNFDLIVIGVGGNDTFELRNPSKWRNNINDLILSLRFRFKDALVVFLNMPPIKDFPAFSSLLKISLGNLVELLGKVLHDVVSSKKGVYFNNKLIDMENWMDEYDVVNKNKLFSDGVHPSEIAYQAWAKDFSEFIVSKNQIKEFLIKD